METSGPERWRAGSLRNWQAGRSERRAVPGTQATPAHEDEGSSYTFREADGEQPLRIDALLQLAEAGALHQFVQFLLGPPAHDPGRAPAMAGKSARNHLELRVPRLPGVDEVSAGFDRRRQPAQSLTHRIVGGEQLKKTRHDADSGLRIKNGQ